MQKGVSEPQARGDAAGYYVLRLIPVLSCCFFFALSMAAFLYCPCYGSRPRPASAGVCPPFFSSCFLACWCERNTLAVFWFCFHLVTIAFSALLYFVFRKCSAFHYDGWLNKHTRRRRRTHRHTCSRARQKKPKESRRRLLLCPHLLFLLLKAREVWLLTYVCVSVSVSRFACLLFVLSARTKKQKKHTH